MTPQKHPTNNTVCQPPANWNDHGGQFSIPVLHATQVKMGDVKALVTFWKPTADELAMLISGGQVQLTCLGGQPACNVSAIPPNAHSANILLPN